MTDTITKPSRHRAGTGPYCAGGGSIRLRLRARVDRVQPRCNRTACLRHCRSPLAFPLGRWRQGAWGAVTNGMRHGLFCLGCCWMLMVLLFVGGLMNLFWIAALALLVLIEKTLPGATARAVRPVLHWVGGELSCSSACNPGRVA